MLDEDEYADRDRHCSTLTMLLNRRNQAEFLLVANEDGSVRFEYADIIPPDTGRTLRRDLQELLRGWLDTLEGRDE